MSRGATIESILFFRYGFAVVLLGLFLMLSRQSFKLSGKQAGVLLILGLLYTTSSLCLFGAYNYIASGLATTLIFLYPVLVAIIMVFLGVVPSWPVWLAIGATLGGVVIMTYGGGGESLNPIGVCLSLCSALAYALFIIIINRSKTIASISNSLLTFYALLVGAVIFLGKMFSLISSLLQDLIAVLLGSASWVWRCCPPSSLPPHSLLPRAISALRRHRYWVSSSLSQLSLSAH